MSAAMMAPAHASPTAVSQAGISQHLHGKSVRASTLHPDGIGYYNKDDGTLHLRNDATTGGASDYAYRFGPADLSTPIVVFAGDWNGDGIDGVGYYNQADGTFHLRNDATKPGPSDYAFTFGPVSPGVTPDVGDWNGSGRDGIGYEQSGVMHLRNDATRSGPSDYLLYNRNDPIWQFSGDWNGDGKDGLGEVTYWTCGAACEGYPEISMDGREPANKAGSAQFAFNFQDPTPYSWAVGVAGDWDGDGVDGVALYLGYDGQVRLYNNLPAGGAADYEYPAATAEYNVRTLVAGRWH